MRIGATQRVTKELIWVMRERLHGTHILIDPSALAVTVMGDQKKALRAPCVTARSIVPSQTDSGVDLLLHTTELVLGASSAAAVGLLVPMESKERFFQCFLLGLHNCCDTSWH